MPTLTPDAHAIAELQLQCVERWHEQNDESLPHRESDFAGLVIDQHRFNYRLWHEEDEARRTDVGDDVIGRIKRAIDRLNQQRNDHIEKLDEAFLTQLAAEQIQAPGDAPLNTETPGSAFDRLSILALKIYHMNEQTERADATEAHRRQARERVARLREQREDLISALQQLLDEIYAGRRRLKIYRQFKMYNDPALNPALYGRPGNR